MLYACDGAWWKRHGGVHGFEGLKLSADVEACVRYRDVHKVEVRHGPNFIADDPGIIATGSPDNGGGNSGFHAINLAIQFGVTRIVLVGFDMRSDLGLHWHGPHDRGLNNPNLKNMIKWRRALDGNADLVRGLGIEMFNASSVSMLTAYPLVRLEDVL